MMALQNPFILNVIPLTINSLQRWFRQSRSPSRQRYWGFLCDGRRRLLQYYRVVHLGF